MINTIKIAESYWRSFQRVKPRCGPQIFQGKIKRPLQNKDTWKAHKMTIPFNPTLNMFHRKVYFTEKCFYCNFVQHAYTILVIRKPLENARIMFKRVNHAWSSRKYFFLHLLNPLVLSNISFRRSLFSFHHDILMGVYCIMETPDYQYKF